MRCVAFLGLVALIGTAGPVCAKQLVIDSSKVCGGMPAVDDNPVELIPMLGAGDGWSLEWKATCADLGGNKVFGTYIARSRVLAARYVRGQDAIAVTLSINEDPAERNNSLLNMSKEAEQYSMVQVLGKKKLTVKGRPAHSGLLGMGGTPYRQDVFDVELSPSAFLNVQREYNTPAKAMDLIAWSQKNLKIGNYRDPAWVGGASGSAPAKKIGSTTAPAPTFGDAKRTAKEGINEGQDTVETINQGKDLLKDIRGLFR